jgi:hypothetical protein
MLLGHLTEIVASSGRMHSVAIAVMLRVARTHARVMVGLGFQRQCAGRIAFEGHCFFCSALIPFSLSNCCPVIGDVVSEWSDELVILV